MSSTRQTSEETTINFENVLRRFKDTMRKVVDAELKYFRNVRSMMRPWSIRRASFRGDSSDLESVLRQLKNISIVLPHLADEANQELRKLLLIELPYEIDDFIDVISKSGGVVKVMGLGYGRAKWRSLRRDIETVLDCLKRHEVASSDSPRAISPRCTAMMEEDNKFLVPNQKEKIKQWLLSDSNSSSAHAQAPIITVWGPGGMGKASLVKKLYNEDIEIRRHFVCFAWVDMPKDFQAGKVMQSILGQLMPSMVKKGINADMSVVDLIDGLHSVQKQKKCLIVLSGVRKENWGMLSVAFPTADQSTRSKILLTTHEQDFAKDIGNAHQIKPLDDKESWELFKRRTGIRLDENTETKVLMENIVSLCKGSRLAIAILTGYFNSIDKSLSDWEIQFAEELKTHLNDEENDLEQIVRNIVSFSYSKLSHEIQDCFLYLGHFPVEREIQVDDLYIMWIDEGLISTEENQMEVARHYLQELSQKNLVQTVEEDLQLDESAGGRRFKSCKLHPLVREFCIVKAENEELYKVIPTRDDQVGRNNDDSTNFVRRLSINYKTYRAGSSSRECARASPRLRSLFVFETFEPQPDLRELELLRVLEFNGVDFRWWDLPKGIGGELICLRYLSFKRCYLEKLPASIGELTNLKTLDLRVEAECVMAIPNVLWKLRKLKRLYFPVRFECIAADDDKTASSSRLRLVSLVDLEILVNFNTHVCDAEDLRVMTKIQHMGAVVEENHKDLEKILGLEKVVNAELSHLSIHVVNFNCYYDEKLSQLLAKLLDCKGLGSLRLEGYIKELPVAAHMILNTNLIEIVVSGAELKADPMPIFEKIPNLRSLTLCNDAYVDKRMNCSEGGFIQLRTLKLKNLRKFEAWVVGDRAMPQLTSLSIKKCMRLAMLPAGLKSMGALKELRVVSMPEEFEERVQKGDDVYKVKHVPRIIIIRSQ